MLCGYKGNKVYALEEKILLLCLNLCFLKTSLASTVKCKFSGDVATISASYDFTLSSGAQVPINKVVEV